MQGGVAYQSRGNTALDMDTVKLLKSQDANYIRTQLAIERSQMARTKAQLEQLTDLLPASSSLALAAGTPAEDDGLVGDEDDAELERNLRAAEEETLEAAGLLGALASGKKGKGKEVRSRKLRKTVFVESREERQSPCSQFNHIYRLQTMTADHTICRAASVAAYRSPGFGLSNAVASSSSTPMPAAEATPVDLGWASPPKSKKAKKSAVLSTSAPPVGPTPAEVTLKSKRHRLHLLHTLSAHTTRAAHLAEAQKEMELQKALMGKGGKKKLASLRPIEESDPEEEMDEDGPQKRRREGFSGRAFKWATERKR